MVKYLAKVFYVLTGTERSLLFLLILFLFTSVLEALGIGLIGPFLNIASAPESIHEIPLLAWAYRYLNLQTSTQLIPILGIVIGTVFCLKSLLYFLAQTYIFHFSFNQKKRLILRLLKAYLTVHYTFHLSRNTASLIKNIIIETNQFTQGCLLPLLTATANLVVVCVLLLLLANTDLLLLALILGGVLPILLLFQKLGKALRKWGKIKSESKKAMIRTINHGLGGLKETRVIGCESYFEQQMAVQAQRFARSATLFQSSQILPRILIETILIVFLVLFISVTQLFFEQNMQSLAAVMGVFAIAAMRLIPSTSQLMQSLGKLQNSSYTLDMLYFDLLEIENQKINHHWHSSSQKSRSLSSQDSESPTIQFNHHVDLKNITYFYPGTSVPAIENISLSIGKGESIALIGKSGAGKTTLVDVILGLLEPQQGDIQVDDVSIYQQLRSWQRLVGYIPQSIFLIDDTIERNIAFGVADAQIDAQRLNQAIQAAQLVELMEQLPKGIKTQVGERGIRLSGGQRQRIGIARALYHEREILVLDEATAALDRETEYLVSESIRALAGTKTLIIIAHRLSTIENCDRVYLLERGRIVQSGSYQEVVSA